MRRRNWKKTMLSEKSLGNKKVAALWLKEGDKKKQISSIVSQISTQRNNFIARKTNGGEYLGDLRCDQGWYCYFLQRAVFGNRDVDTSAWRSIVQDLDREYVHWAFGQRGNLLRKLQRCLDIFVGLKWFFVLSDAKACAGDGGVLDGELFFFIKGKFY